MVTKCWRVIVLRSQLTFQGGVSQNGKECWSFIPLHASTCVPLSIVQVGAALQFKGLGNIAFRTFRYYDQYRPGDEVVPELVHLVRWLVTLVTSNWDDPPIRVKHRGSSSPSGNLTW